MAASERNMQQRWIKRRVWAAVTCMTAVLLSATPAAITSPPAAASPGGIMISLDGINYVAESKIPLFENIGRFVPGDRQTEYLWVRNEAAEPGRLRIDLIDPRANNAELAQDLSMTISSEFGEAASTVTLAQGIANGTCTVLTNQVIVQPNQSVQMSLTGAVDPQLANRDGALGGVTFKLRAVLEEAADVPNPARPGSACVALTPQPPDGEDTSFLENTGVSSLIPAITLGIMTVAGGTLFAILAWRRRKSHDSGVHSTPPGNAPSTLVDTA